MTSKVEPRAEYTMYNGRGPYNTCIQMKPKELTKPLMMISHLKKVFSHGLKINISEL